MSDSSVYQSSESEDIDGVVLCKCGGKIITSNGKVMLDEHTSNVVCRSCKEQYDIEELNKIRRVNIRTVYYKNYGKPE